MSSGWSYDFTGRRIRLRLKGMAERAKDVSPALDGWVDDVVEEVTLQFATEGSRFGAAWAPLTPAYAAWKAVHYPGKTILRRTDKLFESLTVRPLAVERIGKQSATVGTDVSYAKYHAKGTSKMPSRPFLELTAVLQRKANARIIDHIMGPGS